jgi:archaellum component FlaC
VNNSTKTTAAELETTHETVTDQIANGMASLVWWNFKGTALETDELRSVVAAAGMDPDSVPAIDPVAALTKAVAKFSITEGGKQLMEAVITSQSSEEVHIDILIREQKRQNGRLRTFKTPFDRLVWSKVNNDWTSKGLGDAAATKLVEQVEYRQKYHDGNDVRAHVVIPALRESKAFQMTRGMYVVVREAAEPLVKAQQALKHVESFQLHVGTVSANMGFDGALASNAEQHVRDELEELQQQIDGWRDMASRVRSDTIEHVLARFNDLRDRALMYSNALSVTLNDVADDIAAMEQIANEVIDGNRAAADKRDGEKNAQKAGKTVAERRREAIASMPDSQIDQLFAGLCAGQEKPEDKAELVEAIAVAMESRN